MKNFHSHGKLLLSGEYLVLDGAKALAVPTQLGQDLVIRKGIPGQLHWSSFGHDKQLWYRAEFSIVDNQIIALYHDDQATTDRLLEILKAAKQLNPEFLNGNEGYAASSTIEFPRNWGLGTSSTLISNIANWAEVNPYILLQLTFGGSGYDIACAEAEKSLSYQLNTDKSPSISLVDFNPSFKSHLYFVHLNQKQDSRQGIAQYRSSTSNISASISKITTLTDEMIHCETLGTFQKLMEEHEQLISDIIKQTPVKKRLFNNFEGSIKSLGAWGGDFVMVASKVDPTAYFEEKGYPTIIPYSEMIKH